MRDSHQEDHCDGYAALHAQFGWHVDRHFNMAPVCCSRWAAAPDAARRVALREHRPGQRPRLYTYAQLQQAANRLSQVLKGLGVQPGDRVAMVMPQRFETAVAYMAVLQMGAVAMPLSMLFGPEALSFRLQDSDARVVICEAAALSAVAAARADCPGLQTVIGVGLKDASADATGACDVHWDPALAAAPPRFKPLRTLAEDPAVLIYTSGTTGNPKGALIPHRALIGNLTGFVCSQNWFGFDPFDVRKTSQAVFWSPADWAWTGGLMDALLPSLYFGRPIIAYAGRFSPETAFEILEQHKVTHTFLFPTALKAMMKAVPKVKNDPRSQYQLGLQAIMSAGEAVGDAVFAYCQNELGVTVNEMFGQTEINYVVGNCAMNGKATKVGWPARAGSMGRAYPGHRVAVIDEAGKPCPVGVAGDVAVHKLDIHGKPDPIFFLGYWNNPVATAKKYTGKNQTGWCRTGDMASMDADGYLWYQGRSDDMFKAAGYRIGPSEVENCLVKHPAVVNAAVVPKPDAERGALVKAYVVLAAGWSPSDALVAELQLHVRGKLAPYEYPKEIEFIDALPMTTTGKVQRRVLRLPEEARAAKNLGQSKQ